MLKKSMNLSISIYIYYTFNICVLFTWELIISFNIFNVHYFIYTYKDRVLNHIIQLNVKLKDNLN